MTWMYWTVGIITGLVFIYLIIVLLKPEYFS